MYLKNYILLFFLIGSCFCLASQHDLFKQEFSEKNKETDLYPPEEHFDSKEGYKALAENNYQVLLLIARKPCHLKRLLLESIDQGVAENSHKVLFMKRLIKQSKKNCRQDLNKCQEERRNTALIVGAIMGGIGGVVACSCCVGFLLLTGILKR